MNKLLIIAVSMLLIVATYGIINKAVMTGYIILPSNIQDSGEVLDYLRETPEYKDFRHMSVTEPELTKIFLCSKGNYNSEPCKNIGMSGKMDRFGWKDTYYWYVSFDGMDKVYSKSILVEFLIRGDDGLVVDKHFTR